MSDTYAPESNSAYMARLDNTVFTPQPAKDWTGASPDWCDACASAPCQCVTTQPVKPKRRGRLVNLRDVKFEMPEWVKKDWYPAKVATMISGRGGGGKSSLTLMDIADASRGKMRGRSLGKPMKSILVTVEDSQGMQKARLVAAGVDVDYVRLFEVEDTEGNPGAAPAIPDDLPELERLAEDFGADMIIVDPLSSMVHGDLNKSEVIRRALDPLARIARSLNVAVVIVHHHKKGGGSGRDLASGSHAIRDTVRSSILVAADEETGERVLTFDKSNYSTMEGKSLSFELQSKHVADDEGLLAYDSEGNPVTVAVAVITGESDTSVTDIVNRAPDGDSGSRTKLEEAEEWLQAFLMMNPGTARKKVMNAARAADISESAVRRAFKTMRIEARSEGFPAVAFWSLPQSAHQSAQIPRDAHTAHTAHTGDDLQVYEHPPLQSAQTPVEPITQPAFLSPQSAQGGNDETPGHHQSAQSAQSAHPYEVAQTDAQTVPVLLCIMCDNQALPDTAVCASHADLVTA